MVFIRSLAVSGSGVTLVVPFHLSCMSTNPLK